MAMATQESGIGELLNSRPLRRVAVLGANGAMGYQCGALFTLAGIEAGFLARTSEKAEQGLAAAKRSVRSTTVGGFVTTGSYDDDLERVVGEADLIFEAVAEDLGVKRALFEKIDACRREDSIVASVTSGLSITKLAEGRTESFARNFMGLHFFNPPSVIVGTELIAGAKTDPAVVDFIEAVCEKRLGRVTIRTSDTPGFAGNRVGFKVLNEVAQLAERYSPVFLDRLIGPYTGRAMTPLATIDMVGWDVHRAIVDNVHANCPDDEARATNELPAYMSKLMESGTLGNKSGGGFFKVGDEPLVLDVQTGDYIPAKSIKIPEMKFIDEIAFLHRIGEYGEAMRRFAKAPGEEAKLARKIIAGYIAYAFNRVGEAADSIRGIDLIMGCGFNWAPPGVLADTLGIERTVGMIEEAGLAVPAILSEAREAGRTELFFEDSRINVGKYFVAR